MNVTTHSVGETVKHRVEFCFRASVSLSLLFQCTQKTSTEQQVHANGRIRLCAGGNKAAVVSEQLVTFQRRRSGSYLNRSRPTSLQLY
jgi:hypothetical protein